MSNNAGFCDETTNAESDEDEIDENVSTLRIVSSFDDCSLFIRDSAALCVG